MPNLETPVATKLSTADHWSSRWAKGSQSRSVVFNPRHTGFYEMHQLFQRCLPNDRKLRFLEVGAYPGKYMWYFHKHFGYEVAGLEYVEWCCGQTRKNMKTENVPAEVIHGDLFDFQVPDERRWNVVASFGLIEHFDDTEEVVRRHLNLIRPGGYLVLVIPNHHGINGSILKFCDSKKYEIHNCMSYDSLAHALASLGTTETIEGGYYGGLGFWNTGLYPRFKALGRLRKLASAPFKIVDRMGRFVPDTPWLSPNAAVVARKLRD